MYADLPLLFETNRTSYDSVSYCFFGSCPYTSFTPSPMDGTFARGIWALLKEQRLWGNLSLLLATHFAGFLLVCLWNISYPDRPMFYTSRHSPRSFTLYISCNILFPFNIHCRAAGRTSLDAFRRFVCSDDNKKQVGPTVGFFVTLCGFHIMQGIRKLHMMLLTIFRYWAHPQSQNFLFFQGGMGEHMRKSTRELQGINRPCM